MGNSYFLDLLNITDTNAIACKLFNFVRYFLRFISAHFIVAFTIQRLLVVSNPLNMKYKSKRLAYKIIYLICLISFSINVWTPLIFDLKMNEKNQSYCDINTEMKIEYLLFNSVYISLVVVIPSFIIFTSNCMIIRKNHQTKRSAIRKSLATATKLQVTASNRTQCPLNVNAASLLNARSCQEIMIVKTNDLSKKIKLKPHYWTKDQLVKKKTTTNPQASSKKLTMSLLLISFSFVILNFPYLVMWSIFFYKIEIDFTAETKNMDYMFMILQFTETFSLIHYGMKFFVFYFTGSLFRGMFKSLCKINFKYYLLDGI